MFDKRMATIEVRSESNAGRPAATERVAAIRAAILAWYDEHRRDLPWRGERDPYRILVSEIMLQQTQVSRVIPKYRDFLARFPTVGDLAEATRADVVRAWALLGYNRRAVRLHEIARQVVARHGGRVPTDPDRLQQLAGIGRYTANAVACFAGGHAIAVLDTNVRRVLGRIGVGDPTRLTERAAWRLADAALATARAADWNQALMDLGATICVAARPRCLLCPASELCCYRNQAGESESDVALPDGTLGFRRKESVGTASELPDEALLRLRVAPAAAAPTFRARRAGRQSGRRAAEQRSAYRSQPFVGSSRYYRGRVVAALRDLPPHASASLGTLAQQLDPTALDFDRLVGIVERLEADGLVRVERAAAEPAAWQVALA